MQGLERHEGNGPDDQRPHPEARIVRRIREKPSTAEQQTQQEKARRLAVPSGIDGPQQTRLLPERDVPGDELPEIPGFRIGRNLAVHGSDAQIGRSETRVGQRTEAMVPFDGLHEKQQFSIDIQ